MSSEISSILSKYVDMDLVNAFTGSYDSVYKEYFDEDYENTLSKAGKFVENVFRILEYVVFKKKLDEIKQGQMSEIFEKLEKSDSAKFSDTIRVVIPRVAMTIYSMRSKLGSDHVKKRIPDFTDAKFVVSSCDWIMAELLKQYYVKDTVKIEEIIQRVKSARQPKLESFKAKLASVVDELKISDIVIIILRTKPLQTKSQIINDVKEIGRDISSWMSGGNFNRDLIKNGFVQPSRNNVKGDLFSLTYKGAIKAEQLIDKIKA